MSLGTPSLYIPYTKILLPSINKQFLKLKMFHSWHPSLQALATVPLIDSKSNKLWDPLSQPIDPLSQSIPTILSPQLLIYKELQWSYCFRFYFSKLLSYQKLVTFLTRTPLSPSILNPLPQQQSPDLHTCLNLSKTSYLIPLIHKRVL